MSPADKIKNRPHLNNSFLLSTSIDRIIVQSVEPATSQINQRAIHLNRDILSLFYSMSTH